MPELAVADLGEGRRQRPRVRVRRGAEHVGGRALLDDPARVHDGEPVADLDQHGEIVRDEQHGESELVLELLQQLQDLGLDHDVERGRRLVGDDEARAAGQRHRDHHALPLPARELVRVVVDAPGRQPDLLEELAGPDSRLAFARHVRG